MRTITSKKGNMISFEIQDKPNWDAGCQWQW